MAMALNDLGEIARYGGNYRRAALRYEESLRLRRRMGNRTDVPRLLHNLAYVALDAGDFRQADTLFRRSLDQFRAERVGRGVAEALAGLACVATVRGATGRKATRSRGSACGGTRAAAGVGEAGVRPELGVPRGRGAS